MRFVRLKTPPQHDYHWRQQTDQNLGLHFENRHRNRRGTHLKRLLRSIPTHTTNYRHSIRGWDSRDHLLENVGRGVGLVLWSFQARPGRASLLDETILATCLHLK